MRTLIDTYDRRFRKLKVHTEILLKKTGNKRLYVTVADGKTIGELILRSAGAVEQMIGGVTRRLWDDPFEWTLPERMQTVEAILAYLEEVETSRKAGFLFFHTDEDLTKSLPAPVEMRTLSEVLDSALIRTEGYHAHAAELLLSLAD